MAAPSTFYPRLLPVEVNAVDGQPGSYSLSHPDVEKDVTLGAGALLVAREFVGDKTPADIAGDLIEGGVPLPGVDFVRQLALSLTSAGLVVLGRDPLLPELTALEELGHRCVGCGRSCEGHHIGPLDGDFLSRVDDVLAGLAAVYEDLSHRPQVVKTTESAGRHLKWLTHAPGTQACVFLGEDRRCRIHAHFGAEAKPLVCRQFPINLVHTESSVRAGALHCFESHSEEARTPPKTLDAITGIRPEQLHTEIRGLDPSMALDPAPLPETPAAQNWRMELALLPVLMDEETNLEALLFFVASLGGQPAPGALGLRVDEMCTETIDVLRLGAGRCLTADGGLRGLALPGGTVAKFFEMLDALEGLDSGRGWPRLRPEDLSYGRGLLAEFFHLRQWHSHPSLRVSIALMTLGLAVAGWRAEDDQPCPEAGRVGDTFAHTLVAWTRYFKLPQRVRHLFPTPEDFESWISPQTP